MADAVTSQVLAGGTNSRRYIVHLTCVSDGTGETNVVKVDKSTITNSAGVEPTAVNIAEVQWTMQGFEYVKLSWDHTTDDTAMVLGPGQGFLCFEEAGVIKDPRSIGGTGDLLLSTSGAVSGASYDIYIECILSDA